MDKFIKFLHNVLLTDIVISLLSLINVVEGILFPSKDTADVCGMVCCTVCDTVCCGVCCDVCCDVCCVVCGGVCWGVCCGVCCCV